MTIFDEIKKQFLIKRMKLMDKNLNRLQSKKYKIMKSNNFEQYKENDYCYVRLVDRKKFWANALKETSKDMSKWCVGSALLLGLGSASMILGDNNVLTTLVFLAGGAGVYIGVGPALLAGCIYNGYRRDLNKVNEYLYGTYKPLNKCDRKIEKLNIMKERVRSILENNEMQEDVMIR